MNIIGENIKFYRQKLGLTQFRFALLTKVSRQSLHKYESGELIPTNQTLSIYAEVLEVSVDDLKTRIPPTLINYQVFDTINWSPRQMLP